MQDVCFTNFIARTVFPSHHLCGQALVCVFKRAHCNHSAKVQNRTGTLAKNIPFHHSPHRDGMVCGGRFRNAWGLTKCLVFCHPPSNKNNNGARLPMMKKIFHSVTPPKWNSKENPRDITQRGQGVLEFVQKNKNSHVVCKFMRSNIPIADPSLRFVGDSGKM